jgi:hypothetical protein
MVQKDAAKVMEVSTLIRVHFGPRPESLSLKLDGRDFLASADWSENPVEVTVKLPLSPAGNEFMLDSKWPAGTPKTAVSIEIEPDGKEARKETRWSETGSLSELLLFKW